MTTLRLWVSAAGHVLPPEQEPKRPPTPFVQEPVLTAAAADSDPSYETREYRCYQFAHPDDVDAAALRAEITARIEAAGELWKRALGGMKDEA